MKPLLTCLICAAAAAAPEFDVASVKQLEQRVEPGNPDLSFVGTAGKRIQIAGNRVTVQGTLRTLISVAYGVKDYQVSGEPAWADSLIFSVTAKTPGEDSATEEQVRPTPDLAGQAVSIDAAARNEGAGYIDYDIHITASAKDSYDDQSRAIVEAVKSQLGFKLEGAKDPVEMLGVENVAKLAEN